MGRLYEGGASVREIHEQTGLSLGAVHRRLVKSGVRRRPHGGRRVSVPVEQLVALYEQGLTLDVVSARTGVSSWVVRSRLLEAGVTMRGPGRRRIPDSEVIALLAGLYAGGATLAEIQELTGLSGEGVRRLVKAGVTMRPKGKRRAVLGLPVEVLVTRYEAGESTIVLAEAAGVSPPVVNKRLREAGVQLRPGGPEGHRLARAVAARARRRAGADAGG